MGEYILQDTKYSHFKHIFTLFFPYNDTMPGRLIPLFSNVLPLIQHSTQEWFICRVFIKEGFTYGLPPRMETSH